MKKTAHDLLDDMRYSTVKLTVERNEGEESFGTLPEEEKKRLREFPIWRYWRTAME